MAIPRLSVNVGKSRLGANPKFPWEPGYVQSVRNQTKALEECIKDICRQFTDVTPDLLVEALKPTFEKAKEYCPKDTHALVNSGYLESVGTRTQPRVEMGFAKGGTPFYAVLVHENLDFYHAPPTQAKFLERAVDEDLPDIAIRIGENYRAFMNG